MDLLKREQAPILDVAWHEIDKEACRVLKVRLAGRKVVDFEGPFGWDLAAVNLGRLRLFDTSPVEGLHTGVRQVQPLVEVRAPFQLDIMELDSVARGAHDPDLQAVVDAARKVAVLEDTAIFHGYGDGCIRGICEAAAHEALTLPAGGADYPQAITRGLEVLRTAGIGGPYALALGREAYDELSRTLASGGYPVRKHVAALVGGPIVWAPALQGAVLLSMRGGDFVLSVGQDHSIGYAHRTDHTVELYLTETFTFRVLEPQAAVVFRHGT